MLEGKADGGKLVENFLVGLLAKVADGHQLALLHVAEILNGLEAVSLQAVVGTDGEIEILQGDGGEVLLRGFLLGRHDGGVLDLLVEVLEELEMFVEDLAGEGDGGLRGHRAIGRDIDGQLLVAGIVSDAVGIDDGLDLQDGGEVAVDGNPADRPVGILVVFGKDEASSSPGVKGHLDVAILGQVAEGQILVDDGDHVRADDETGLDFLLAVDVELERVVGVVVLEFILQDELLDVQDDLDKVFEHAFELGVLMLGTLDFDGIDGKTGKGGKEDTPQGVPHGDSEAALKGRDDETSLRRGDIVLVDLE